MRDVDPEQGGECSRFAYGRNVPKDAADAQYVWTSYKQQIPNWRSDMKRTGLAMYVPNII